MQRGIAILPFKDMPFFEAGVSVARELVLAAARDDEPLKDGEIIVVAQKIVSKSEGRSQWLCDISPSEEAKALAQATDRSPELAHLILEESSVILRQSPAAIITRHRTGHVMANAGIDASNVGPCSADHEAADALDEKVLLWPINPDTSAQNIRAELYTLTGCNLGVVIADSLGRAWRIGTLGTAIGCAGITVIDDQRGGKDLFGRTLKATMIGVADGLAAMGVMLMGEGAEGVPAARIQGGDQWVLPLGDEGAGAVGAVRPAEQDLFR